jgi:hypothetical protein
MFLKSTPEHNGSLLSISPPSPRQYSVTESPVGSRLIQGGAMAHIKTVP